MDLHYLINPTMRALAEEFFLPSLPEEFEVTEHVSAIKTSGEFDRDGYTEVMIERTDAILKELEGRLDGSLMLWCDVDIVFFRPCADELTRLAGGKDLLFQKEWAHAADVSCNFGVQVIRRTPRSLAFYARLSLLQKITDNAHDQPWGNRLLTFDDAPRWAHLPLTYASETNGGVRRDSALYHANGTVTDSMHRKNLLLANARRIASSPPFAAPQPK